MSEIERINKLNEMICETLFLAEQLRDDLQFGMLNRVVERLEEADDSASDLYWDARARYKIGILH